MSNAVVKRGRLDWRLLLGVLGVAVAYGTLGRLGLGLAHYQTNASLVWPPAGLALAALVLLGRRYWLGVFLGALAVNFWVGTSLLASTGISIGNTGEALVGAWLLQWAGFRPEFGRMRDVLIFAGAVLVGSVISASVGVVVLGTAGALGGSDPRLVWLIWYLGDVGGAVLVAPLLFVVLRGRPAWGELVRRYETWFVAALLAGTSGAAFGGWLAVPWLELLASFASFPLLMWAGLRMGPRGAVIAGIAVSTLSVFGTATGRGPFARLDPHESLLLLWAYATCLALGAAILAAAVAERDDAENARARAEEERRVVEERSQRAHRLESLGVLAGGVAHDFNNLLMAIRGNAELLRKDLGEAAPEVIESLEEIDAATIRSADLCRQMMDYAGRSRPRSVPLDLVRVVEETRRLVRGSVAKKITIDIEGADQPCLVMADATQLSQVVMNLLLNASEAIGSSEGHIWVRLSRRDVDRSQLDRTYIAANAEPGRYVALTVADDGIGMDAATLERIFEPFFSMKVLGHGLGLASVAGIVRAHHGAVEVQSTPGAGTRFTVLLLCAPEGVATECSDAEQEVVPMRAAGTVLVADDQSTILRATARALGLEGWQVHTAADGRAALGLFEDLEDIDIVVLDIDMPGLDGIDALASMRTHRPELPAVLMSGKPLDQSTGLGCQFLPKPFTFVELHGAINRARDRRSPE